MRKLQLIATGFAVVGGALLSGNVAHAADVWTPETGEVQIESMPRNTPEQERAYALALLGIGEWREARRILLEQIEATPNADWVIDARIALGRSLLNAGRPVMAFNELDGIDPEKAGEAKMARVREMQFETAHVAVQQSSLSRALKLVDRMAPHATTYEDRAFIAKERADLTLEDRRHLQAMDRYMTALDEYPGSTWVPYCEYGMAVAEWRFASWLMLGLQDLADAEQSFRDFVEAYPSHPLAPRARAMIDVVRGTRALAYKRVALFYIEKENRPWAAVPYLEDMAELFGDMPAGAWAAQKNKELLAELPKPLAGRMTPLSFGVATEEQEGGE